MEGARATPSRQGGVTGRGRSARRGYSVPLSPKQAAAQIRVLEHRMYQHARDLEFEEAASVRDEVAELRRLGFMSET